MNKFSHVRPAGGLTRPLGRGQVKAIGGELPPFSAYGRAEARRRLNWPDHRAHLREMRMKRDTQAFEDADELDVFDDDYELDYEDVSVESLISEVPAVRSELRY